MITGLSCAGGGVIFDGTGKAWPDEPAHLAHLGPGADHLDVIAYAVKTLGVVHVVPVREALLVTFEPSVVSPLAAVAAFYEISARAAKPLILVFPGTEGHPDRCEVFNNAIEGLRRFNDEANLMGNAGRPPLLQAPVNQGRGKLRRDNRAKMQILGAGALQVKSRAGDRSMTLSRPLACISDDDAWLRQLLSFWGDARKGRRLLPSTESLDALQLLNIARGRAHIVDTTNSNPAGYRFRLWGAVNSYGGGYDDRTLGDMPVGLMRDEAIRDYRQVVATGKPAYHLINFVEKNMSYSYARLLLPLAQDRRRVDRLIVLISERRLPELGTP